MSDTQAKKDDQALGIEYMDGLYGYALTLSRDRTEADDLVQETYLRAFKAMSRLRADSNIKSWLFTILRNIWLDQLRKRRTKPERADIDPDELTADPVLSRETDPYELYVRQMEQRQVAEAIQQLSVEFREVLFLREYEGLPYQEIALLLRCPTGTVMSRLYRARSALRAALSHNLDIAMLHMGRRSENEK